jgi:predicted PurR-regulated permease PerM
MNPDAGQPDNLWRTRLLSLVSLILIATLLLAGVYAILSPFAEILLAAAMLTVCFYPAYVWIHQRVRNPDLAALVCILFLLILILVPLAMLGSVVAREAQSAYGGLQRASAEQGGWANYVRHFADAPAQWISARTGMQAEEIKSAISERAQAGAERLVAWSGRLIGNLTSTLTDVVLTLFVMFFMFPAGERFGRHLHEYVPISKPRLDMMMATMKSAITANLYGMIAVAASQGMLVGLGFALTGLPSAVFWGVVATFSALIPIIGTALVVGPAVVILGVAGAYGKAIFLLVWGVVVVGMSDNFIRPMVLKKGMEMNTLAIFLSLMGGVQAFGFIGLFAGPVILTMAFVILRILNEERLLWQYGPPVLQDPGPDPIAPTEDTAAD